MDTPIISPVWFYLVDVVPRVGAFLGFFGLGLGVTGLIILAQDNKNAIKDIVNYLCALKTRGL